MKTMRTSATRWAPVALLTLVVLGFLYQEIAARFDLAMVEAPGRHIDIGDVSLHLYCLGEGEGTVVLEAGATGFAQTWSRVQTDLATSHRVCAYDRAGMGWSSATDLPVDGVASADRLHALLTAAGERPPYVMVGHSLGGMLALTFADRYRDDVAALVFVDSSHPDQLNRFTPEAREAQAGFVKMVGIAPHLARFGILRATNLLGRTARELPEADYRAARMFAASPVHLRTSHRELLAWDATMAHAAAIRNLDALPVLALSATRGMDEMGESFLQLNHAMHAELARLSTNGLHLLVPGADHFSILMNEEHARHTASMVREFLRVHHQAGAASR